MPNTEFILIDGENVTKPNGTETKRVVLVYNGTPSSLSITGADVPALNDDDVIAAGSVLFTPSKNYIAFEDGTFTEKA